MDIRVFNVNKGHSLKKRYFFKLFSNIIGQFFSVISFAIIPRGLGPKLYGDFNFLTNFFTQFIGFFEMGTSVCFYTKLSQRPNESKLVSFYLYFIGLVSAIVILFVLATNFLPLGRILWPDQKSLFIFLAAFLGLFVWVSETVNQMSDALGLTVYSEIWKIFQKIIALLLITAIFLSEKFTFLNFYIYNFVIYGLLIFIGYRVICRNNSGFRALLRLKFNEIADYTKEFYKYSHPLFVYSLIGMIVGILERWLLQIFSGSVEQGFFGLSFQISNVCFLFAGAMTPLFTREFSIAFKNNDFNLMRELFSKHLPLLYVITAFFACFVAVNADKVTIIMGGGKFKNAVPAVAIMAFYPIHRVYGQLSGSVFYATEKIALYRNIGIISMAISIPFTYFLIAPKEYFGLQLAANGLAIKFIVIQFLTVNAFLYFSVKFLKISFRKYFFHQIRVILLFLAIGAMSGFMAGCVLRIKGVILNFLISGIFYSIFVMAIFYLKPETFGFKKDAIRDILNSFKKD